MKHEKALGLEPILKKLKAHKWKTKLEVDIIHTKEHITEIEGERVNVTSKLLRRETDVVKQLIEEIQTDLDSLSKDSRWQFAKKYTYALYSVMERYAVDPTTRQEEMSSRLARYAKHIST